MSGLFCTNCGENVPFQFEGLKPGQQFMVGCPHCGFTIHGAMGLLNQPMPKNAAALGQGMWPDNLTNHSMANWNAGLRRGMKTSDDLAREERHRMGDAAWKQALDRQDREQALLDAIRGPEKVSIADRIRSWVSGHRF